MSALRSLVLPVMALALVTLPSVTSPAQELPAGDMRIVSASAAGSGTDLVVRYFAEKLKPIAQRTILVENRPGASGNIATEFTARSKPDGLTVYLHTGTSLSANMHISKKPPVDVAKALQVVATTHQQPFMIVVHPDRPWRTLAELTAHLREKGDKASYAVTATSGIVVGALYKEDTGIHAVEVKYRTAQDSMNDLASGALDYAVFDPQFVMGQVTNGKLRVLAISAGQRLRSEPSLPTMTEQGVKLDYNTWFATFVPSATPRATVNLLNRWINQIVAQDETRQFFNRLASDPFTTTPDEGQAMLVRDVEAFGNYIRIAKIPQEG